MYTNLAQLNWNTPSEWAMHVAVAHTIVWLILNNIIILNDSSVLYSYSEWDVSKGKDFKKWYELERVIYVLLLLLVVEIPSYVVVWVGSHAELWTDRCT